MAGSKRPSFLKRQKEQARLARAAEKRETRRARKHAKASGLVPAEDGDDMLAPMMDGEGEAEGDAEGDAGAEGEEPAGDEA
jgi:hypothetical protein